VPVETTHERQATMPRRDSTDWKSRSNSIFNWWLRDLRIGLRLRLVFACVLVVMITGGTAILWQFRNVRHRIDEILVVEQRATAIMQINNSVLLMMSRLHRAADSYHQREFEEVAREALETLRKDTSGKLAAVREVHPSDADQSVRLENLTAMLDSLPGRVASLIDLARAEDWMALHARLTDQVDRTDELAETLMQETGASISQARVRLFEDIGAAERRVARTLVISSLLSIAVAGLLGFVVTNSITRPLEALDRSALSIARGDFQHELRVRGSDELAHVASAFNRMTRELADLYTRESEARRTAEHLNQTLRRTNDDLSVFAYSASHDLQEPLRGIVLYSQMLKRKFGEGADPEVKEFIGNVVDGATRMSELIKDLLAYLELATGRQSEPAGASSEAAVGTALANLRTAIATNDAKVAYSDLPEVAIEPVHLQQLFQNLIGNAIKYRGEEPPAIQISASRENGSWLFSVRDNGIGVAPQHRTMVFGLFKRLNAKGKFPGTGIGLAICQKIVERYGGKIWIESAPEKGSDFRFTLPCAKVERGSGKN
jgi:signal transduction histidine kinase